MRHPRFRISTLLWLTLAVACWFGGMGVERWREERRMAIEVADYFACGHGTARRVPGENWFWIRSGYLPDSAAR